MNSYRVTSITTMVIILTALLLSVCINIPTVHAVKYKKFKFSYIQKNSYPKLHIYAKNGKWVGATSKEVKLAFLVDISLNKPTIYTIEGYRIELPGSSNDVVDNYIANKTFTIDWPVVVFPGKNFGPVVDDGIKACNDLLAKGANPEKTYTVPGVVSATARLRTIADSPPAKRPFEKTEKRHIPITVVCERDPDWKQPSKNKQITSVDIKFHFNKNDKSCPVGVTRKIIVKAKKSGIYKVHVKKESSNSPREVTVKVGGKIKNGKFTGEAVDNLGQVTAGSYRYRVTVPKTKLKSPWRTLNVQCEKTDLDVTKSRILITKKHLNGLGEGCPVKITAIALYETTLPGKFVGVIRSSYDKEWKETIEAVKAKGKTGGSFKVSEVFQKIPVYSPKYQAVAVGHPNLSSEWADAKVKCQFKIIKATLKYDVPSKKSCSKDVEMTARIVTTAPGDVKFRLQPKGGKASNPITIKSKLKDNKYVAVYNRTWKQDKINQEFRVVTVGSDVKSKWKRLKIDCPSKVKPGKKELSN